MTGVGELIDTAALDWRPGCQAVFLLMELCQGGDLFSQGPGSSKSHVQGSHDLSQSRREQLGEQDIIHNHQIWCTSRVLWESVKE